MTYTASPDLLREIKKTEKKAISYLTFRTSIVILFSIIIYSGNSSVGVMDIMVVLAILGGLGIISYSQLTSQRAIANSTAVEINIENDNILIKTAPFNVLLMKKDSMDLQFSKQNSKIRQTIYTLNGFSDLPGKCVKLIDSEKEVCILIDYFDEDLSKKLTF